ncbi:DUF4331 family protein [Phenylobacterium sp.]|uniref:DUF4331 family protein n=1 Tax=Phenylobacterium sp. TaxID=1871053 RepID=UPI002EDA913F
MLRKRLLAAILAPLLLVEGFATAADHAESPGADADQAADLADVFLFVSPENNRRLVGSITFGGRPLPRSRIDQTLPCDPRVIYVLNIDRASAAGTFDSIPEVKVVARFGTVSGTNACGAVQLENVPGAGGTFIGAIETVFTSSTGLKAFAGLRNDPFFFDAEGYNGMIAAFDAAPPAAGYLVTSFGLGSRARRDSFANRNVAAIVFEMDIDAVAPAVNGIRPKLQVWATTARRVQ